MYIPCDMLFLILGSNNIDDKQETNNNKTH